MSDKNETNVDARQNEEVRGILAKFATERPGTGQQVARHLTPENKVSIPEPMSLRRAAKTLVEAAEADEEEQSFSKTFKYRPWDGAAALMRVLENYFGTTGKGVSQKSFFGNTPPQTIEIEVGHNQTIQVPWGQIAFAPLEAVLEMGATRDEELGSLFTLSITCPKKYSASVSGLFHLMEEELQERSIYRGAAIRGTEEPKFLNLSVDSNIVYNDDVYDSLETAVWGVIREAPLLRSLGVKTDPKVLLHGPYGTGKSEAGRMTAKVATENGWTFIMFNSGKGGTAELEHTLQTARLLSPAVVFIEDLDIYAGDMDEKQQSRMLELFDGISSKNHEVMVVMTSNKPAKFSKGMLRAGRINKMIEIGQLDRQATEKLIRNVNAGRLGKVDFDEVWAATQGYEPAFIRQTFDDARQAAAIRHASELRAKDRYTPEAAGNFKLVTSDFVTAANLMRPQHDQHAAASEAHTRPTMDLAIRDAIASVLVQDVEFTDSNDYNIAVARRETPAEA